jgi:hypothetical protein
MLVVTAERTSENKMPRDVPSALAKIARLWINVKHSRILFKEQSGEKVWKNNFFC